MNKVLCVEVHPAAFRERKAARYLGIGIHTFRALVKKGIILARVHGSQRLYLRVELDAYLHSLPIDLMAVKIPEDSASSVQF